MRKLRIWFASKLVAIARRIDPVSIDVRLYERDLLMYGQSFVRVDPRDVYFHTPSKPQAGRE